MVSFSFGKKRKSTYRGRPGARKGYSQKDYLKGTGNFSYNGRYAEAKRSVLDPVPASDLDFGRRRRRRYMGFGATAVGLLGTSGSSVNISAQTPVQNNTWMPDQCPTGKKMYVTSACKYGRRRRRSTRRMYAMGFLKKRRSTIRRPRKGCAVHRKRGVCITTEGCSWKKGKGCMKTRKKAVYASKTAPMSGDDDLGAYAEEAGISFFGRRRGRKATRRGRGRKVRKNAKKTHADFRRMPRKLPAKIRKLCRKLKIKCTKKVGSRKVNKKLSVLKRQIARRLRKVRRSRKSRKVVRRSREPRRDMSFGRKRKGCRTKRGVTKKLPAKLRKLARKLKIKTTKKVGNRRVCKSMAVIKRQIARRMRKVRGSTRRRTSRKVVRRRSTRRKMYSRRR